MGVSNLKKNLHLLWRAGFGPSLAHMDQLDAVSQKSLVEKIFVDSSAEPSNIDVADDLLKEAYKKNERLKAGAMPEDQKKVREMEKRKLNQVSRENIRQLNLAWLNHMVESKQQLREKMSLFWHGHFAARSGNVIHQQLLLDATRRNALGNFADLLRDVSKSASMINYLNNNQNRKGRPNENFAREVMELFTLGRGNYTEKDVKEAARAFTGWGANAAGEFIFRKQQHDDGEKTFLGKSGKFTGDDILTMLLEQKQTARHITEKIYRFYVNETIDDARVSWLATRFYNNKYSISKLLEDIFTSDWFYDNKNIGNRIKSPVELITGLRRTLSAKIENEEVLLVFQRLLGQLLFYPPNVAGWPGGFNWIDSSSLMLRMQLPGMVVGTDDLKLKPKDDDDQMMGMKEMQVRPKPRKPRPGAQVIRASVDWHAYVAKFEKVKREQIANRVSELLLIPVSGKAGITQRFADDSDRESFIRTITAQLMSTPEYQLC
jgi:uncharacterized protein (DUF1800 family)